MKVNYGKMGTPLRIDANRTIINVIPPTIARFTMAHERSSERHLFIIGNLSLSGEKYAKCPTGGNERIIQSVNCH